MRHIETLIKNLDLDSEGSRLVYEFFLCFSRMECVLKRAGHAENNPRGGIVIKWDGFREDIEEEFNQRRATVIKAIEYLCSNPPKAQTLDPLKGTIFKTPQLQGDHDSLKNLIFMIKQVRNNLFHGGKSELGSERDQALLRHSLEILETILDSSPPWFIAEFCSAY